MQGMLRHTSAQRSDRCPDEGAPRPRPRWHVLVGCAVLAGAWSSPVLAQPGCVPTTVSNTWTVTAVPSSGTVSVDVAWPGLAYSDHGQGFNLHFTVTRGGPASWDLGCGVFFAADAVSVPLSTALGSSLTVTGSGVAQMLAYGTGPILNGTAFQHLLDGPGGSTPFSAETFSASLGQGIYDQWCGLDGDILAPGGGQPQPGAPVSANASGDFACFFPAATLITSSVGMALVPEPLAGSSLALGLLLVGGWAVRRRAPGRGLTRV